MEICVVKGSELPSGASGAILRLFCFGSHQCRSWRRSICANTRQSDKNYISFDFDLDLDCNGKV